MLKPFSVEQGMKFPSIGEQSNATRVAVDEESKDKALHFEI